LLLVSSAWMAEGMLISPQKTIIGVAPIDLPCEDISIQSLSGATLRGWFLAGSPGRGAVLLLHGVRANRLAMLPRAIWLHELGYSVLLIDFQAAGESSGQWITFGLRESDDAISAVAYLRSRLPQERIGIIGTSMGGAAALLASPPLRVDAMVLEQVYPSIDKAVNDRLMIHQKRAVWLAPLLLKSLAWRTGIEADRLRPIDHIAHIEVPKLLVVGSSDRHTHLDESIAMYAAAASPKELWIVDGAQHVDLYRYGGDDYKQRVGAFLSKWLRRPEA
jgi:fermentation-respiration switch protein FrsA (DUF1100 family)